MVALLLMASTPSPARAQVMPPGAAAAAAGSASGRRMATEELNGGENYHHILAKGHVPASGPSRRGHRKLPLS